MNFDMDLRHTVDQTELQINKVIQSLRELIDLTEEKYSYIYETLPQTEIEIKSGMREIEMLLDYLVYTEDSGKGSQSVTIEALEHIQEEFAQVTESFINKELIEILMRTFLEESGQDEQSFSEIGRLVKDVKDVLADLRDLALNSLIFSIKVGAKGLGFQILADRINQISTSLGEEFSRLDRAMTELENWNQDFRQKLLDFVNYEETLKTKYKDKFEGEFSTIVTVLQVVCRFLNDHMKNASTVVRQVPEAMVLIQDQDIIRQNIENLVKCWEIVIQKKEGIISGNQDQVLNYLVFVKKVGELADLLLDNIEKGLQSSLVTLEGLLEEINEQASELEIDTEYLGAFFAGAGAEVSFENNILTEVFSIVLGQVLDLLYIKRHLESKSDFLIQGRETFVGLMELVQRDFQAIDREIRTLKKMRVLIKIELSRINQEDNNSMQTIVCAVDQVIETVSSNQKVFNKLSDYFLTNINDLNGAVSKTRDKLVDSGQVLEISRRKLSKTQELVIGAVRAMVLQMGQIYGDLKAPYVQIQVKAEIEKRIAEVRRRLEDYQQFISVKERSYFLHFGVDQWEDKEDDLHDLLHQFTCYIERKSATSVFEDSQIALEDHSADIVLF